MEAMARPAAGHPAWVHCDGCRGPVYAKRLARNLHVCQDCGRYHPVPGPQRLRDILDEGSARPLPAVTALDDPLHFHDVRPFAERQREARNRTGLDEAVVCAAGMIMGNPAVVAVMDFAFLGGSLGCGVGERITQAAEHAVRERIPLIMFTASGGARMQEGALALMQMAKTSQAIAALDEAGLLTVSIITDPTYGGVAASYASLSDVILAEPGARMGFAGPRVIEQTIRQKLPDGFQRGEFLFQHGLVDGLAHRVDLRWTLARLLHAAGSAQPPAVNPDGGAPLVEHPDDLEVRDTWETVQLARHPQRPTTLYYAGRILDQFVELHGDRMSGDCPAIVGGTGLLDGMPVMLLGHEKGTGLGERIARNFGMGSPHGFRKAARLLRLAAKLGLPVISLIDTPGAHPGADAEQHGQAIAIAENLRLMSRLPVPIVAVVAGEGGSGGALALGVADRVLALSGAIYSVISPEGCAAILWRDAAAAPAAAAVLGLDARELLRHGIVDAVIPEPDGGAHRQPAAMADRLRQAVSAELRGLLGVDRAQLLAARWDRFRRYGLPLSPTGSAGSP